MSKRIIYMAPVDFMSGSLCGRQQLTYGQSAGKAYDLGIGERVTADGYAPAVVAMVQWAKGVPRFFQVRTKYTYNMTYAAKMNLALMGGSGALFAALLNQKSSSIYIACVNAYNAVRVGTFRSFMVAKLRAGLAAKDAIITIADGVTIVNPWISSDTPNVPVSTEVLNRFAFILSPNTSPYSAAATEALMAAFTAEQWEIIRDYGVSHPAIVGYMNAYAPEDPKIAYSLVEGIGTRYLVGDGTAYIDLGCKGNLNTTMEMQAVQAAETTNKVTALFGDTTTLTAAITIYTPTTGGTSRNTRFGNVSLSNTDTQTIGSVLIYKQNKTNLTINDNVVGTYNATADFTTTANLTLFRTNGANGVYYNAESWISKFKLGGDYLRDMIPFKRNNELGMIDLLTGIFYGNANNTGTFTENIVTT